MNLDTFLLFSQGELEAIRWHWTRRNHGIDPVWSYFQFLKKSFLAWMMSAFTLICASNGWIHFVTSMRIDTPTAGKVLWLGCVLTFPCIAMGAALWSLTRSYVTKGLSGYDSWRRFIYDVSELAFISAYDREPLERAFSGKNRSDSIRRLLGFRPGIDPAFKLAEMKTRYRKRLPALAGFAKKDSIGLNKGRLRHLFEIGNRVGAVDDSETIQQIYAEAAS